MTTIDNQPARMLEALPGDDMKGVQAKMRERLDNGEISPEEYWGSVQYTLAGVLQAVDHMQNRGVTHCDIKPANVMYDAEGNVKVMDLGGARVKDKPPAQGWAVSPGYAPADIITNRTSEKHDVYTVAKRTQLRDDFVRFESDVVGFLPDLEAAISTRESGSVAIADADAKLKTLRALVAEIRVVRDAVKEALTKIGTVAGGNEQANRVLGGLL